MTKRSINPEEKKAQVIQAARKLFVDKGYFAVSIPEIVKKSGVSVGAIYLHFESKKNLAAAIYQKTLADFLELFHQRLGSLETVRQKLHAFAELVFDITEEDPDMIKYMMTIRQCPHPDCAAPLCSTTPFVMIQDFVAAGIASGEIKPGDHFLAAISYTGVILRAVDLRLQGVLEQPLPEIAGELIGNAWSSIKSS
jgi:AcrR family transcriptional regulator